MEENEPVVMRAANLDELVKILDDLLHGIHETVQGDENSGWFDKVSDEVLDISDVSALLKTRVNHLQNNLQSIANQLREQYLQILSKDLKHTSIMDIIENLYTINRLAVVNLQDVIYFDVKATEKPEEMEETK